MVYNLAQSYYVSDNWEALLPIAEQLVEIDPLNQNAYSFLAQALIRLERDQEGVAVLDEREALEYFMEGLGLQFAGDDLVVAGQLVNNGAPAGSNVTLRVHFYDVEGGSLGTQEATVELGAEGEPVVFQVVAPEDETLFGFRYELI